MMICQFQFPGTQTEQELEIIPDFCYWICDHIYTRLNTKINRRKIQLRINYLYTVPWMKWSSQKYIDEDIILNTIHKALYCEQYRYNIWRIRINKDILVPNTNTSIDTLVRFLEYGDRNVKAMGMFTKLRIHFIHKKLNILYKIYCNNRLGYYTNTNIITD